MRGARRAPAAGGPVRHQGQPLASRWLPLALGLGLAWIAGLAVLAWYTQAGRDAQARIALTREARLLAGALSQRTTFAHRLLAVLAKQPDVARVLRSGDASRVAAEERRLEALFPNALRVRLLPPGYDQPRRDESPPLAFASLELLRKAGKGDAPPPLEVQILPKSPPLLVGAAAIRSGTGEVVGLIHLTLAARPLFAQVQGLDALPGRLALRQKLADGGLVDLTSNGVNVSERRPEGSAPIGDSRLEITWWSQPLPIGAAVWWWTAVGGALLLFLGALLWWHYRGLRRVLLADQAAMVHLVEEALSGQQGREIPLLIKDLIPMRDVLIQRLTHLAPIPAPSAAVPEAGPDTHREPPPESGARAGEPVPPAPVAAPLGDLPAVIFKAYDIRGIVGSTLTPDVVREIGRAVGSQAYAQGEQTLVVARDQRPSSSELGEALVEGILSTGCDVVDLGVAPVPLLYFATRHLRGKGGVMVTGSHNPAQYNGLKIVLGGESLSREALWALRDRVIRGDLLEGQGTVHRQDLSGDYIARMAEDVGVARPLKVVLECGGGSVSELAPALFRALGCEPEPLHCELAGGETDPLDPSLAENLAPLQAAVREQGADLGLAFDGDGDRLGVVDSAGRVVTTDRVLMLFAADLLARHPGADIIYDVKCSRALAVQILQHGGRPVMWKSGHSLLKARLNETGALLAGEWSGHIMFRERWNGFDDALYAGARLCEILAVDPRPSAEVFDDFPVPPGTPELFLHLAEGDQESFMERIRAQAGLLSGAKIIALDGLRAEFEDGWGLVRVSNTVPALSFRFEGETPQAVKRIQKIFAEMIRAVDPGLELPF